MLYGTTFILAILVCTSLAYPAEEKSAEPSKKVARLAPGFSDDPNSRRTYLGESENEGIDLVHALAQLPEPNYKYEYPPNPVGTKQEAVLEHEPPLSKIDSKYGSIQQFVADIVQPKPIVDTISEKDKYGNNGDQFRSISTAVVNGFEGFSNLLNTVVELPFEAVKQVTRKASSALNSLTAKFVGI